MRSLLGVRVSSLMILRVVVGVSMLKLALQVILRSESMLELALQIISLSTRVIKLKSDYEKICFELVLDSQHVVDSGFGLLPDRALYSLCLLASSMQTIERSCNPST